MTGPYIRELDFSMWHPLDHWPGTARCRSFHGGTRNHLHLTWTYRRRHQVLKPWWRLFRCPFGRHDVRIWYGEYLAIGHCEFCDYHRSPTQAEMEDLPPFLIGVGDEEQPDCDIP